MSPLFVISAHKNWSKFQNTAFLLVDICWHFWKKYNYIIIGWHSNLDQFVRADMTKEVTSLGNSFLCTYLNFCKTFTWQYKIHLWNNFILKPDWKKSCEIADTKIRIFLNKGIEPMAASIHCNTTSINF